MIFGVPGGQDKFIDLRIFITYLDKGVIPGPSLAMVTSW